jgi:hypothetical protein
MRTSSLLASLIVLAGCAAGPKPEGAHPRPESVGTVLLRIAPDNLDGARLAAMAEQVGRNLNAWGYAVTSDAEPGYSHVMEARVGAVEKKSTPTGFSFGIGNSDPRAVDFQKAEVLPVTCELRSATRPKETASLYMGFVAGEKFRDPALLVNHIGTVCFNLLDDLKVPRRKKTAVENSVSPSSWVPEVRIEVREKPAAGPTEVPASPVQPEASPPVQTETRDGEGRKQVIIHNQGAPVILEFGYERK